MPVHNTILESVAELRQAVECFLKGKGHLAFSSVTFFLDTLSVFAILVVVTLGIPCTGKQWGHHPFSAVLH
jgi:hypothetical protein